MPAKRSWTWKGTAEANETWGAVSGQAICIASGDSGLLVLKVYLGIASVYAANFLTIAASEWGCSVLRPHFYKS
jgi:hypothetical protein